MAEVLETVMLICFGCSWPMSLVKNIKAKTAKGMSIGFTLLILTGYIAGITAKIMNHGGAFVLAVYIFNLVIVSANLVVYFINKKRDKQHEAAGEEIVTAEEDNTATNKESNMSAYSKELSKYSQMNEVSSTNGIVFFGSTSFNEMPLTELARDYDIDEKVYNRSISGLTIADVDSVLDDCVLNLSPKKVFISIGEEDIEKESFNEKEFLAKYEWMLYTIHDKCDAQIYIVSILSRMSIASRINERLSKLAKESGCTYIDAASALYYEKPEMMVFEDLKPYIRSHNITFAEAMKMAN